MTEAVIVDAIRTPGGKRNGQLKDQHPVSLAAHVLKALEERNGLNPADVDDVIMGCVMQVGEQSLNIGRNAVLSAGWPETVPATTVDRQCGSSQQSMHFAAQGVIAGAYDVVVAAGASFAIPDQSRLTPRKESSGAAMKIVWQLPTYQFIKDVLQSPFYAGVYFWGRRPTEVVFEGSIRI